MSKGFSNCFAMLQKIVISSIMMGHSNIYMSPRSCIFCTVSMGAAVKTFMGELDPTAITGAGLWASRFCLLEVRIF